LARIDGINTLEEVGEIVADNENAAGINQSGVKGNRTIWDRLITGTGQVIGVLDKGVPDPNHCLLNAPGKILQTRNISMSAPSDHATFMAASAAGNEAGNPTNAQRGGAWGAQLVLGNANDMYEVKNVRPALTSFTYELNTASLLTFIHSNSWHDSDGFSTTQVLSGYSQRAVDVDLFTWTNENHLVLGSSGPGSGGDTWGPPAIAKNALAVSATSVNDPMTFGAGFATPPSGRIKPDIVAAGCNISSAQLTTIGNTCGATSNACSSSSAATAHAAGTAALVRQYFTDGWYPTGTPQAQDSMIPTGALLKATLINSAQDMTMEPPATNTFPSQREGWGVVTLDHTLFFSGNAPSDRELKVWDVRRADVSPVKALAQGESHSYSVSVEDSSEPLKVTLVWFDYPSSNLSQGAILNDLDLIVTSPPDTNGTVQTYRGNVFVLGSSAQVTTAASRDYKNSVEQVLVNPPTPPGTWTLRVEGTTVQEPASQINVTQGYALVATANFGTPRSNPRPCVDLSWVTTPNGFRISYPRRAGRLCGFVPLDEVCRGIGCPLPCDPRSYCPALRLSLDALRQRFFVAAYDLSRPPTAADREILPATDSLELERREGIEYGIFFFPVDDRRSDGTYDIRILPSE
jgi:hypothetical protein